MSSGAVSKQISLSKVYFDDEDNSAMDMGKEEEEEERKDDEKKNGRKRTTCKVKNMRNRNSHIKVVS